MSNDKTYPTHRISFSEKKQGEDGRDQLGQPVEVATVWPRKGDKQGGIIQWHISPDKLDDGVYFMLDNERQQHRQQEQHNKGDSFDQTDNRNLDRSNKRER